MKPLYQWICLVVRNTFDVHDRLKPLLGCHSSTSIITTFTAAYQGATISSLFPSSRSSSSNYKRSQTGSPSPSASDLETFCFENAIDPNGSGEDLEVLELQYPSPSEENMDDSENLDASHFPSRELIPSTSKLEHQRSSSPLQPNGTNQPARQNTPDVSNEDDRRPLKRYRLSSDARIEDTARQTAL